METDETITYIDESGRVREIETGKRVEFMPRLVIAQNPDIDYTEASEAVPQNIGR